MDSFPGLYPLTSLQVGNIKYHLSRAFLFFATESHKFLILVDNQSWRKNKHSRSMHLMELMSTKYRTSPSGNSRSLLQSCSGMSFNSSIYENKGLHGWVPNITLSNLKEKAPFSVIDSYKALHGFIVFEVKWKDVRGINYTNELQTDASMALETKFMRKWEFSSINQALCCISSWFPGMPWEMQSLQESLVTLLQKSPLSSKEIAVGSKELLFKDSYRVELFPEDACFNVREFPLATDRNFDVVKFNAKQLNGKSIEPVGYHDTFLLFRFDHRDLPYKLKKIITSDLKLLVLLEAGLPSWVIFLQSYPLLCKVYRHWMRSALRTLFIVISLVTVVIGFYDLYKNVPPLRAAISNLSSPLVKWIEDWDMFLRIRYIGTIIFLKNLEKAVKCFMVVARIVKVPVLVLRDQLIQPLEEIVEFLKPVWCLFAEVVEQLYFTIISLVMEPLGKLISDLAEVLLSQLACFFSPIFIIVKFLSTLFWSAWQLINASTRGCVLLGNGVVSLLCTIFQMFQGSCMGFISSVCQLRELAPAKPNSLQTPNWHLLSDDLYSKIFRSLRNVIQGLIAFYKSCIRHRISIYSYTRETLRQLSQPIGIVNHGCSCRLMGHQKAIVEECDDCESE